MHSLVSAVLAIVQKYKQEGIEMYMAGSPSVNHALKSQMQADMQKFMLIQTFLVLLVFLFVMFRRASAVFYPLIVIILSLLATVGTMAWSGVAFKLPTIIGAPNILAVRIPCDSAYSFYLF